MCRGWADASYHGGDGKAHIQTPEFEKLLEEGIRLNRHYTYNWCAPSRASLLTGRLPVHVNVNATNQQDVNPRDPVSGSTGIPSKMTTIARKMKQAGYATHYNGKWGVGWAWPEQMPLRRGFDSFLGYLHDSNDYYTSALPEASIEVVSGCEKAGIGGIVDLTKDDGPAYGLNGTMWEDYLFFNETIRRLTEHNASTPLFLLHAFHSVHAPLNPPEELEKPYKHLLNPTRRAYAAMTTFVDSSVGQVVAKLKEKGMWQDTLLVVSNFVVHSTP